MKKLSVLCIFQLIVVLLCAQFQAFADENVTNGEFLQLYFELSFHEHSTTTGNIVAFLPIAGPADKNALVYITQYVESPDVIKMAAFGLFFKIDVCFMTMPTLAKRWPINNPRENLLVRYVRESDGPRWKTLGVTIDGVTSFDPVDFKRAKERVEKLGGVWSE